MVGAEYGLKLHWGKIQVVKARTEAKVLAPDGSEVAGATSLEYLGSRVHEDGRAAAELTRRIAICAADFRNLSRIWKHSHISLQRKVQIYNAIIVSRLLYGLSALWLGTPEQKRLDGFHCYCLRRIARIPSAYYSHVSNAAVYVKLNQQPLSHRVLRQQLLYLQKVAVMNQQTPLRAATFHRDLVPLTAAFVRKIGRPRHTWAEQLLHKGLQIAGSQRNLEEHLQNQTGWRNLVVNAKL